MTRRQAAAEAEIKKGSKLKPHPAANLFPMMTSAELDELAADIAKNGQHDPIIITSADLVLDGRNRLEACRRAKVEPEILMWDREDDGISPTSWVMSKNLHRRHLTTSQRGVLADDARPLFEAEAKARMKAGAAKGGAAKGSADLRQASPPEPKTSGKAAAAAAKTVGVSTRLAEQVNALKKVAPAAEIQKIRDGEKTINRVERETKRATQVAQVRVYQPPTGQYAVIVADPPWQYGDQLDGSDASRGGCPYPTMPLEEICALKPPAAADCVLWLWTTNAFLADGSAARVVKAWGFEPKTILTWIKPRMGLGRWLRNITEHCILAVRGSPKVDLGNQTTELRAPLGEHSAKPAEFYALVEGLCPSPSRIEMFAREQNRKGWVTTGSELPPKREGFAEGWARERDAADSEAARAIAAAPSVVNPAIGWEVGYAGKGSPLVWRPGVGDDLHADGKKVAYQISRQHGAPKGMEFVLYIGGKILPGTFKDIEQAMRAAQMDAGNPALAAIVRADVSKPTDVESLIKWKPPLKDGGVEGRGRSGTIYRLFTQEMNAQGSRRWFRQSGNATCGPMETVEEAKADAEENEKFVGESRSPETPKAAALLNWKPAGDGTEDQVAIGFGGMLYRIGATGGKTKVFHAKAERAFLPGSWAGAFDAAAACETEDARRREYAKTGKKPRKPLKIEDVPGEVVA